MSVCFLLFATRLILQISLLCSFSFVMKIKVQVSLVGQSTKADPNLNTKRQERSGGWRLCGDMIRSSKTFL